jgi:hypothetical protein
LQSYGFQVIFLILNPLVGKQSILFSEMFVFLFQSNEKDVMVPVLLKNLKRLVFQAHQRRGRFQDELSQKTRVGKQLYIVGNHDESHENEKGCDSNGLIFFRKHYLV